MKKICFFHIIGILAPFLLSANPIAVEIINEFQSSSVDSQRIE